MSAHEIHALSGAYAVDALDDLERAQFEKHLASCAECQAEVASLQDTTLLLSEMTAVAPPASVRDQVLADIRKIRPLPPVVARLESRRPRRWANLVAAAAVLGALGTTAVVVQAVNDDSSSQVPASAAEQVITAADAQHWNVEFPSGAVATVYRSESVGRAALLARGMSAAPKGRVYQLWLLRDGKMVPAGLMTGGEKESKIALKGDANTATGAGITIEPEGGSPEPTTDPIAEFDFGKSQA